MTMTRHLMTFMYLTGYDKFRAIGVIDQMNEVSQDCDINEIEPELLAMYIGMDAHEFIERNILALYNDIVNGQKADKERDRKRTRRGQNADKTRTESGQDADNIGQREGENTPPDGSSSPTPPISPLSPEESKRDINNNNAHTRVRVPRPRFRKPTELELNAYAQELGYTSFNAGRFLDYYETKGWKVGRDPMKDWKAAVRTWKRNDDERRGITTDAEPRRDTDNELFDGFTPEEIEQMRRIAQDGDHWG